MPKDPIPVHKIHDILARKDDGQSVRQIAEALGLDTAPSKITSAAPKLLASRPQTCQSLTKRSAKPSSKVAQNSAQCLTCRRCTSSCDARA
jgi:hypothetical protein